MKLYAMIRSIFVRCRILADIVLKDLTLDYMKREFFPIYGKRTSYCKMFATINISLHVLHFEVKKLTF